MKIIDERDTIFSRANLKKDSHNYKYYYSNNPDKKSIDDSLRSRPQLCEEGTMTYNSINSPIPKSAFEFLSDIKHLSEGTISSIKVNGNEKTFTKRVKGLSLKYGANIVGITKLKKEHIYSHKGRHEDSYGDEINLNHEYAIVFGCEMEKDMINRSPMIAELVETSKCYVDAAIIGMILSYYIRNLGYDARNHMDSNYLVIPTLIARDAGLGQIGRNALLTNKYYGSRLRLGVVTTNLPLKIDEPVDFGLDDFCRVCKKCSQTCPSQSLSNSSKYGPNGEYNWSVNPESCYIKWRYVGTDCGICISACPFSQELDTIKNNNSFEKNINLINEALDEYKKKFGTRVFMPGNPNWLR